MTDQQVNEVQAIFSKLLTNMVIYHASEEDLDNAIRCSIKAIDEVQKVNTIFSKQDLCIIYELLIQAQMKAREERDNHSDLLQRQDDYFDWMQYNIDTYDKYIKRLEKIIEKINKYMEEK